MKSTCLQPGGWGAAGACSGAGVLLCINRPARMRTMPYDMLAALFICMHTEQVQVQVQALTGSGIGCGDGVGSAGAAAGSGEGTGAGDGDSTSAGAGSGAGTDCAAMLLALRTCGAAWPAGHQAAPLVCNARHPQLLHLCWHALAPLAQHLPLASMVQS